MSINDDFHAFLAQRGQELAAKQNATQTDYERRQRLNAEGGELFSGLFAQLDENNDITQEPATADPTENDFNKFFNL
jgi:hypothetical protein